VIVDSHHHLWDPALREYPWMAGEELAPLRRRYDVEDLRAVAAPLGVTRTVVVQAVSSESETVWLLSAAAEADDLIAAVVGWIDLKAPDVSERIAALSEHPGGARLVGVRHQVQDEPDPRWLLRPDVIRGLEAVASANLAYDLLLRPGHLPAALELADSLPELRVVVDHGAKPEIARQAWEPWSSGLARLAANEQVHCKLSGLVTEATWDSWRGEQLERYIDRLLELFGPERLMFGSDWPVCTLAASYAGVLDLVIGAIGRLSESERTAILAGTAGAFYELGAPRAASSHASTPAT
jgi:L-fucono-1,5-lactonase